VLGAGTVHHIRSGLVRVAKPPAIQPSRLVSVEKHGVFGGRGRSAIACSRAEISTESHLDKIGPLAATEQTASAQYQRLDVATVANLRRLGRWHIRQVHRNATLMQQALGLPLTCTSSPGVHRRWAAVSARRMGWKCLLSLALRVSEPKPLLGRAAPQSLANAMHAAWVAFAANGDCGCPKYEPARRPTMHFDTLSRIVNDPLAVELARWKGVR
jgi:hypothetical protein